ncbi:MAG TPA: CHAT domain-containing protein [Vicinamibacterales bacterium]|nr:CHAT domain-containing protein [Vicinamibacterales bacterium]
MANEPVGNKSEEWAALFYLCGHYNRPEAQDPFVAALDELRKVPPTASMSTAVYLDLESGAQRIAIRSGEVAETEFLGAVNSGDPETLEQFLGWAFDACPARRYLLVMAGLGIMDSQSVVGRPPFDSERMFAICDDRATDDAIELHELSATLRAAFPDEAPRRLVVLACDMYAMQFMEVAYELRGVLDLLLGIQVDERHEGAPVRHWPYAPLLKKWQEVVAAPVQGAVPRWRSGSEPHTLPLATETVSLLAQHYQANAGEVPVTVSAINLQALAPVAQALDTFSVVYLQWLSNDVIWRARETVVTRHMDVLKTAWSYDLAEVADAIRDALTLAANQALVRWAIANVRSLSYPRLSRVLRALGAAARDLARTDDAPEACRVLADEISARRTAVERAIALATTNTQQPAPPAPADIDRAVLGLFADPDDPEQIREPEAWTAIITAARRRLGTAPPREMVDAFDGIDASRQLGRLAKRVADLARGQAEGEPPAVVALWPAAGRCGMSLYRPIDLNKLAHSNYLELRFSRELHWTALLTAVDLIKNHARMLWRLLESQLTAAPLEARYQLMRRLAGDQALTGRHAEQLKALSAPNALFLTIEPVDELVAMPKQSRSGAGDAADAITSYRVRLSSIDRSTTAIEHRNQLTRERLENVLEEIDAVGSEVETQPVQTVQRLARCGSLLGDDVLYGVSERLAEIEPLEKRAVHLVLQMPRELMRYPWELLRDRRGWLIERFAIGRQVIAEGDIAFGWGAPRRHGPLRLLVVAPSIAGQGAELAGVGALEGAHVAACFERLQERLPGLVDARNYRKYVDQPVTVDQFRALIRERRFDVVHFAGHGRYDPVNPERSCWMFSDGPLYAFELRHTLANASVIPWLLYGSACEAAREAAGEPRGGYHDGIYGMASAALGQGVSAYLGPLWKISETDAKNMAAAFYEALLLRRASLGEALALARRSVKIGEPDLDELVTRAEATPHHDLEGEVPRSAGWTGMVLYGDPTPTVLQRISPSDASEAREEK